MPFVAFIHAQMQEHQWEKATGYDVVVSKGCTALKPTDSERRLAIILDREALQWFKPARGQFQLSYKSGTDHLEYQLDFVAETVDYIYMIEAKARNDLHDVEVQSKQDAAVQWCSHATRHALSNGGKPWQYLLIAHDVITENMTIAGLASQFRVD